MPSARIRRLLVTIWICFLFRGWFYASMFPLWEGYDEFAHFGVVRAMAAKGILLPPRDQPGQRDVEESFKLVPVPWEFRGWNAFRSSLTEERTGRSRPKSDASERPVYAIFGQTGPGRIRPAEYRRTRRFSRRSIIGSWLQCSSR